MGFNMSVLIYKQDESGEFIESKCEALELQSYLDDGYSLEPKPTALQADKNKSGKLSASEIREAAKQAGIENYENARISTLKEKLGYGD